MNSTSIADYILKLERENRELQSLRDEQCETIHTLTFNEIDLKKQVRDLKKSSETHEESRTKIEQLKKLLNEANEEKVAALNSLYKSTQKCVNQGLVDRLLELGETTSDFYKAAAYNRGAEIIRRLNYEVESGESVMYLRGIGKSIATKIDEYLEEQDPDYEESVASNDYESDEDTESEVDDYFISYNHDIYTMLMNTAGNEHDPYKRKAYTNAASKIYHLPYELTSGEEAMKLPGIGKSIAKKIDNFFRKDSNSKLADCFLKLGNLETNQYKAEAYWLAEEKLRELDFEVTSSEDVKNIRGFGPSICAKIDEFVETGTMKRLNEFK